MRDFKIRNLVIQVLPEESEVAGWVAALAEGCQAKCSLNITDYTKTCDECCNKPSGACVPCSNITKVKGFEQLRPADLMVLKAQLQEALNEIAVRQRVQDEKLRPQNLEDINALETHLLSALDEVRARKSELEGKTNK